MISIKTFAFNSFQVNTYVVSDNTGEAIIIDPACESDYEEEILSDYISSEKLNPIAIANTHAHIDHIIGINRMKSRYNIPLLLHADDELILERSLVSADMFGFELNSIPSVDEYIDENKNLTFGNSSLKVFHIPGHSPGSLTYYSSEGNFVVVGDVLFYGSIGRTDLPGGNHSTLISGIKNKLFSLPKDTIVYSGHGPTTTIQKEYDTNPFLI